MLHLDSELLILADSGLFQQLRNNHFVPASIPGSVETPYGKH